MSDHITSPFRRSSSPNQSQEMSKETHRQITTEESRAAMAITGLSRESSTVDWADLKKVAKELVQEKEALEKAEKGKTFWMRMTAMAAGLLGVVSAGVGSRQVVCG